MTEAEEAAREAGWTKIQQMYDNDLLLRESAEGDYHHGWNAAREFYQGQWMPILSEADLPKENGIYFVTRRGADGALLVDHRGFVKGDPFYNPHWLNTYIAWAFIQSEPEPYVPQEKP